MAKSSLVSHIILFSQSKDNDALLINILSRNFSNLLVIEKMNLLSESLQDMAPKVLFISCETLQESLGVYYQALDEVKNGKVCDHSVVGVISRHDEKEAYEAYCCGIIDDYLVARPLYELHRPVVICQYLLKKVGLAKEKTQKNDFLAYQKNYSDAVQEIITKGIERKDNMKKDFEASLAQIDKALDAAAEKIQKHQKVKLDMEMLRKTLSSIKSDEVRPELLKIQNKAMKLLEQAVSESQSHFSPENMLYSDDTLFPDTDAQASTSSLSGINTSHATPKPVQRTAPVSTAHSQASTSVDVLKQATQSNASKPVSIPKVLIIEDDEISLHLTQVLLGGYKLEFDSADTGRRAFACLNSYQYDLVLMDITLPDTNGLYILDQIKNTANLNKQTPIIMLTGNKNKNTVKQAIDAGAKGYIIKPLHQTSVVKLFEKYHLPLIPNG